MWNFLKWKRTEFCLKRKSLHEFLEKKADHVFQEEFAALRQDYLKRRLNWAEENGKGEIDVALDETGRQLESQRMELYQFSDQAQREKSWQCE